MNRKGREGNEGLIKYFLASLASHLPWRAVPGFAVKGFKEK